MNMAVTLYGIKNCDTVKKARAWLDKNRIDYTFHDFRRDGIDKKLIQRWMSQIDWRELLNTRGTTWRRLPERQKQEINKTKAVNLMLENPAVIKRPVLSKNKKHHAGFKDDDYENLFKSP